MSKTPDISIIIPAYNAAESIAPCLDSILVQDGIQDCEIIVVNDGSTDNTGKIVQEYCHNYNNIQLITQKNSGVSVARNNAMSRAHGHFVSFVDADDMVGLSHQEMLPYFIPKRESLRTGSDNKHDNLRITFLFFYSCMNMDDIKPKFDTQYFVRLLNPLRDNATDISLGGKITISNIGHMLQRTLYVSDHVYDATPGDKQKILYHAGVRESANFALYRRKFLRDKKLTFLPQMDLDEDILFTQQAVLRARNVATVSDATYLYIRHLGTLSNMMLSELGCKHKFDLARIQRYSMLLNELRRMPEYTDLYSAIIKEFSDKNHRMLFYTDCVPADKCGICTSRTCKKCSMHQKNNAIIARNISDFILKQR
ncbi:MAG: glycosyltransferase [Alphaproteobacteria bacterium]|nr:glycosyltransferase [Alphaproteobacteria bacterium]